MKKWVTLALTCLMALFVGGQVMAETGGLTLIVNGKKIHEGEAYIDTNNRKMLPVEGVSTAFGAVVATDNREGITTISKGNKKIVITINQRTVKVNDAEMDMDTAAVLKNGKTFVPAKYMADAFNASVAWDEVTKTLTMSAKTKKESDLKKPLVYEDVRGHLNKKIYTNESFGFTMNLNSKAFSSEISNQEGYKYHFAHPTAIADDDVLSVYTPDFAYVLRFVQSNMQSHSQKTAADILAYDLTQYKVKVSKKMLGDKEAAYTEIAHKDKTTRYYAMSVNGYYIRWEMSYASKDTAQAKQLDEIVSSIYFDWNRE